MAGNLPVANTFEAKFTWHLGAVPYAINILHYIHPIGFTLTQAFADSYATMARTAFTSSGHAASIHTSVSLARIEVRGMTNNSDPWWVGAGTAVSGTAVGHPLPAATSFVISLKTGLRGRSFNGRCYLWGFTEDANDANGAISTSASAAAVAFVTALNPGTIAGQACSLAVLSRFTTPPEAPPGTPATERNPPVRTAVSSIIARDGRWDVQRRRAVPGV